MAAALVPEVIWRPYPGPQTEFMQRLEDEALFGGTKGPGKTDVLMAEGARQVGIKNYRAIILRRTFPQLREIIDRGNTRFPRTGGKWRATDHCWVWPSRARYYVGHCQHESDWENYQGHEYHYMGFDQLEQFTKFQYDKLGMMVRSPDPAIRCYIRASANPGGVGHWWVKRRFIDKKVPGETYNTEFEVPGHGKIIKTSTFIFADHRANPSLAPEYLAYLMSLPEEDRKAYMEGDWNIFANQSIFDQKGMQWQQSKARDPMMVCELRDFRDYIEPRPDANGRFKIWEQPEEGEEYIIGADVGYGDATRTEKAESGDPASVHVISKRTWSVVADWHGWVDPHQLAQVLFKVGLYYNASILGVEINGPGIATIKKLQELGYSHLYSYADGKPGWLTSMPNRNMMITTMQAVVREMAAEIRSQDTLDEMFNFIRHEKSAKIAAREGCHDDRVMSLGIAYQIARVNPFETPDPRRKALGFGQGSAVDWVSGRGDKQRRARRMF